MHTHSHFTTSLLMIWNLSKFFGLWVQFCSRISTWRLSDKLTNIWMTSFRPVWLRYIDTYGTILRSDESILNMKSFRNEHHHHRNQYELDKIVCGMRHKSLDEFRRSNHPNQFRAWRNNVEPNNGNMPLARSLTQTQTFASSRWSTVFHTDFYCNRSTLITNMTTHSEIVIDLLVEIAMTMTTTATTAVRQWDLTGD